MVAELRRGAETEVEIARIECGTGAGLAELGLRPDEAKRLTAALQAQLVPAQVAASGEYRMPYAEVVLAGVDVLNNDRDTRWDERFLPTFDDRIWIIPI